MPQISRQVLEFHSWVSLALSVVPVSFPSPCLRCPLKYLFSLWLFSFFPFPGTFIDISAPARGDICLLTAVVTCVAVKSHPIVPVCCLPAILISYKRMWGLSVSEELGNAQV